MGKITVEVTKDDISAGIRSNPEYCPVALALKRCGFNNPTVGFTCAIDGPSHTHINFPEQIHKFIMDFDYGISVEPVTFEAEVRLDLE